MSRIKGVRVLVGGRDVICIKNSKFQLPIGGSNLLTDYPFREGECGPSSSYNYLVNFLKFIIVLRL